MKKILTLFATCLLAITALNAQELTNFAIGGQKPIISP